MLTIGDFARHGRVSVRMLRHYDSIGLLRPAQVDPITGYRTYEVAQLFELNRIVALKNLGFSLDQVRKMTADKISLDEVRAMLTMRRAELESELAERSTRLAQVEARIQSIEDSNHPPLFDIVIKDLPSVRLIELTGTAASFTPEDIKPVVRPLCAELGRRLLDSTAKPDGRLTCYYERQPGSEDEVLVHAAVPASVDAGDELNGLSVADLPASRAATIVHRGSMDAVLPSWQALVRWLDDNGLHSAGPARELYLDCPEDESQWITELQEPID
jgi:DNA-binding transcriptional MerR regulator